MHGSLVQKLCQRRNFHACVVLLSVRRHQSGNHSLISSSSR
jgi:hypothetical protein